MCTHSAWLDRDLSHPPNASHLRQHIESYFVTTKCSVRVQGWSTFSPLEELLRSFLTILINMAVHGLNYRHQSFGWHLKVMADLVSATLNNRYGTRVWGSYLGSSAKKRQKTQGPPTLSTTYFRSRRNCLSGPFMTVWGVKRLNPNYPCAQGLLTVVTKSPPPIMIRIMPECLWVILPSRIALVLLLLFCPLDTWLLPSLLHSGPQMPFFGAERLTLILIGFGSYPARPNILASSAPLSGRRRSRGKARCSWSCRIRGNEPWAPETASPPASSLFSKEKGL